MSTDALPAVEALHGVLAAFAEVRDDGDYIVRASSNLDGLGSTPSLTWGDLRSLEQELREQVARDIESLHGRPPIGATRDDGWANALGRAARVARGERP